MKCVSDISRLFRLKVRIKSFISCVGGCYFSSKPVVLLFGVWIFLDFQISVSFSAKFLPFSEFKEEFCSTFYNCTGLSTVMLFLG